MKLRVASAALWFVAGWYVGNILAELFGVGMILGPLLGAATAGVLVGDPLHLIWTRRSADGSSTATDAQPMGA
jgi:hypothetical protein